VAFEILPHPLALICRLVSTEVDAITWHVRRPRDGELRADGVLADVAVSILISTHGRPTTNSLRLIAERGTARIDLFHGFGTIAAGTATRGAKITRPFLSAGATVSAATTNLARRGLRRESAYPGLRELVRRFYLAAADGSASPISPEETLAVATAGDRIAQLLRER
jgi:hypothetical protein